MMTLRILSRDREYRALFEKLREAIDTEYGSVISLTFNDKRLLNKSWTNAVPNADFPREAQVGVAELFVDYENGKLRRNVQEKTVVRAVVNAFHECRHAEVFEQMQYDDSEDMQCMSMANLAILGNEYYNTHNWGNFCTEIDAEAAGVKNGFLFLSDIYGQKYAEKMILQYVNRMLSEVDYTIPDKSNVGGYTSIQEVFDAFSDSFEKSKHGEREYWDVVIPKDNKENEIAYNFIWNEMSDDIVTKWNITKGAYERDKMIATIVLHLEPEYAGYHASLEDVDLSMDAVFGPNWQKQKKIDPFLKKQQGIEAQVRNVVNQRNMPVKRNAQSVHGGLRQLDWFGYEDRQDEFQ